MAGEGAEVILGWELEQFLLFEEHHHCQHQPKPPAGSQQLPGGFFGMHQGLSCCVGLLSVLTHMDGLSSPL